MNSASTAIAVRACTATDAAALSLVGAATFLDTFAGVLDGVDVVRHCAVAHAPEVYVAWIEDARAGVWMATMAPGDAPLGYVVLAPAQLPVDDARDDDLEIKRIYVMRNAQGTGLGAQLLDAALSRARTAGARRVLLGVYAGNARARSFYERRGFSVVGTRRFRVGARDYDDVILVLPIGENA